MLYNTDPYGNIRMYTFGIMILWKWPSFSFEKNKSGIHTLFASVSVKYLRRPVENVGLGQTDFLQVWFFLSINYNHWLCTRIFQKLIIIEITYLQCHQISIVHLTIVLEMLAVRCIPKIMWEIQITKLWEISKKIFL